MNTWLLRPALALISLVTLALPAVAGQLDDYYLAAFGERTGSALEKALLAPMAEATEAAHCGTPLKHGLQRDWNHLEPATQKVLAKQLAAPALSGEQTLQSSGGHFLIHYATTGSDVPAPSGYTVAQWPNIVLWLFLASTLGLRFAGTNGAVATSLRVAADVSLLTWALDEVLRGVNPFRRLLGLAVLSLTVTGLVRGGW